MRDPAPDRALIDTALAALIAAPPALQGIGIAEAWGGTIDSTPDTLPVIAAVGKLPGFFLAT
ncbi:MAG: D-amino-acid oxidase, partial [Alphaproteobacteria bacterium]|nr:D-amino-acid oxidase [Alphaproteobacteria bacterium]